MRVNIIVGDGTAIGVLSITLDMLRYTMLPPQGKDNIFLVESLIVPYG